MAVGICDRADIVGALCASLDLQARDAGIEQRGQMVDHAHIAGVKDICPLFVLSNIKHLAGALGLRETVLPAAGLRTAAAVGIASGEIVRQQAAAGKRHAHRPMDERLKLQLRRRVGADGADLGKRQLTREHDPLRAEIVQRCGGSRIDHAELRAHVQRHVGRIALGQRDHAEIGRDDRVHARIVEQLEVRGQLRHLVITRQGIARHVHGSALCVRKLHGGADAVRRKVFRTGAHTELRPGEIHCVRAV